MATMFQGLSYRVLLSTTHFVLVVTSAKTLSGVLITCAALVGSAGGHPGDPRRGGGGGEPIYVRPAAGLVGRAVVEALSRGSEEGSRNVEAEYFLSTWLWPSSSKAGSTP